jgi:hypothetical protein
VRIAAVVVNWNGGSENLDCVASLFAQAGEVERVILVDNASRDEAWREVPRRFPAVEAIASRENLGYGGGNNLGIARALELGADAVLVVNNDVVLPPGTVRLLREALERHPDAGIVGPRVLRRDDPGRVWAAGGELTWRENLTTLRGHGQRDADEWRREVEVDYVVGCALLVRREVIEKVGGFDASYFAYTEDVDLALRARRAGYRSIVAGEAAALHAPSSATGGGYNPRRKYMMGVNSVWFLRRWGGAREWGRFVLFDVVSLPFALALGAFRGRARAVLAKALGILDGLRGVRVGPGTVERGSRWLW